MTTIAGASRYLTSSSLANSQGIAPSTPTLLGNSTSSTSILDAGRSSLLSVSGPGLSSSARSINQQFLSSSQSNGNTILSLAAGVDSDIDGAKMQILALRASLPDSSIGKDLALGSVVDEEA